MNSEQITTFVRQILLALGSGLVTKGYVDSATLTAIVGGVIAVGTAVWGLYVRRSSGLIASAAALPNVAKVVADPSTANNGALADNPKVVSQ